MATKYSFDNKQISLPGAYSTIKSAIDNPPIAATYGRVLVIDNNVGATFGGGSGIDGELANGLDAIYRFQSLAQYQSFLAGGIFWKATDALFNPGLSSAILGASEVLHVKAATTTCAIMTFTATGGGTAGGTFKVKPRQEGVSANGVITGTGATAHLDKGYGYTVQSGVKDTTKWIMKIWRGSWKGDYTDGIAYDEIAKANTKPDLIIQSPEFNNIQDLLTWGATPQFNQYFYMDPTSAKTGLGTVTSADITGLVGYTLAIGATETYSTTNLDLILEAVKDVDYNFLLSDQFGTVNYDSASSSKMFVHLRDQAQFLKFMIVGGGKDQDEFDSADGSIDMAEYFNNIHAVVVHGNVKKTSQSAPDRFRYWNALIHAAYVTGRLAGLEPQVPVTNKALNIDGVVHPMTDTQKESALEAGVLCTNYNQYSNTFNVVQGINTLQNNTYLVNSDATSFSIQMMRIVSQVNRTLVANANTELLLDERGVNMNTLSPGTLVNWTKNQLQNMVASQDRDNLIISYDNVTVTRNQDSYFVNYEIVVNGEITKVFFTGFMI
jgi:hypothetical protein